MEKIFKNALKKQLSKRVKGVVSVHIVNNVLIVDINSLNGCSYHYTINNIAAQLSVGLSSKIVSDVIVKQYKKCILKYYFH
jgi:hypothetical protein